MSVDITSADEVAAARSRAKGKRAAALEAATQRHPSARTAVDALGGERPTVMLDVEHLEPHPDNPRRDLGDLTDLTADIAARGVDSPLTVVPLADEQGDPLRFRVVIGHRRRAAAIAADVPRVPCIIRTDLPRSAQRAMMLRENSHRADLSPVEEADAIQAMLDVDGLAVDDVALAIARSETTVRRRMRLANAPDAAKVKVHAGQATLEQWEKVLFSADGDEAALERLAAAMGTRDFDYQLKQVERERATARADAAALAWIEQQPDLTLIARADLAGYRDTHGFHRYVNGSALAAGRAQGNRLDEGVPPGSIVVQYWESGGYEVWTPRAHEPEAAPPADDDGEPAQGSGAGGSAQDWGDPDAAQAEADEARRLEAERRRVAREEHETARQLRAAFVNGLTGARFDQARLWAVCHVTAELLAMQAVEGDVLDVDADVALDLDVVMEEAVKEAEEAGDDPDTVAEYEVKSAAAPRRIEELGGPPALVRLVASGCEASLYPADWYYGLRGHELARAYYRLLDALGYVPSSVEEAALTSPEPQGAAS